MRRVAVAMSTTGPEPKQGHRITELAAVEVNDGAAGKALHLRIAQGAASEPDKTVITLAEALTRWTQFVAGSPLVVHDYYEFKRFLRAECKRTSIGFDIARDYPVIDTWLLARERYPRQRHGLAAVIRKLGIEANPTALDALGAATMVARVADTFSHADYAEPTQRPPVTSTNLTTEALPAEQPNTTRLGAQEAVVIPVQHRLMERLARYWRQLTGREA